MQFTSFLLITFDRASCVRQILFIDILQQLTRCLSGLKTLSDR